MTPQSRRNSTATTMFSSPILSLLCLLYIFSSTVLAASAVLGVDLGTEYIKAALVKPGIPLEIVLTKDSRRKEMSAVAFKPSKEIKSGEYPERVYGSDAVALAARFPSDVYPNLKTLLGLGAENSVVLEYASRHPSLKLETEKTRGTAAFRSSAFSADEQAWMVEEILAMELQSIQKNAEALAGKGSIVKDLVITVPVFYTAEEKRSVQMAAELAGLRVLELISDGLAVGLNYAMTRQFPSVTEGGKPEHHLVFDMGAGSTKATVLKFQGRTVKDVGKFNKTIQEVQVLGSGWDRTLGGDALNAVVVDNMISQFVGSKAAKSVSPTIESVKAHGRAAAKLWKEAERLRQILSANANTQTSFEGLYEDVDFRYKITRAEYEKLAAPYAARIGVAIQKALDAAGLKVMHLDSIILHGGAIRTPFVQKELEKFVGKGDKIRTNVNADESAVFGAAFRGAGLSPSFRVKEIRTSEGAIYAVGIKWTNINEKPQNLRLWQPTSFLGAEKQYTFKNQKDFSINFYQHVASSENVSPGSTEKEILTLTTQNLTESVAHLKDKFSCTDSDINLRLSTLLSTSNGEVEIIKLFVDCEVDISEEKAGVVDSIKGVFGFGKKEQAPLSEEESSESSSSSSSSSSTSEGSSSASSSSSSSSASASASAKDPKPKITKRMEVIPVKFTTEVKGLAQLPASDVTRMKDRIAAFEDSDRSRRLREEALNQLEGFTYKARDLLESDDFIEASTEAERTALDSKSKAASDWIYSGGHDASREELKSRLKEMKDIVAPIEKRKEEAAARPEKLKELQQSLDDTQQALDGVMKQMDVENKANEEWSSSKSSASASPSATPSPSTADGLEDLEDNESSTTTSSAPVEEETPPPVNYKPEDLAPLQNLRSEISNWLTERLAEQAKLAKTDDPAFLVEDLVEKAKILQDARVDLVLQGMKVRTPPKPKVKKTSTKKTKTAKTKKSKTTSAKKGEKTPLEDVEFDIGNMKAKLENGGTFNEEDILQFIKSQEGKEKLAEESERIKKEADRAATEEKSAESEKHDEL